MADWVTREAYSHEVSSCGFWFGGGTIKGLFYAYAYPAPEGFSNDPIQPPAAFYSADMQEFVLPYEAVCQAENPDAKVSKPFRQISPGNARTVAVQDGLDQ